MSVLIAMVVGFALAAQLPVLPPLGHLGLGWLALVLLLFLLRLQFQKMITRQPLVFRSAVIFIAVAVAFSSAVVWGHWQWQHQLPSELEGKLLLVEGKVSGLPADLGELQRFELVPNRARLDGVNVKLKGRLRLSWYGLERVASGERWQLAVRLKRPHGFWNPGGFDYELWLFSRRLSATGYVANSTDNIRLKPASVSISGLREHLRERLQALSLAPRSLGVLTALMVGDKSLMDSVTRDQVRQMGLSHLLAISGLHIGLAAGLGLLLGRACGRFLVLLNSGVLFSPRVAVQAAWMAALFYALLAGLSLPTQRALIMLAVWSLWYLIGRRYSPWLSWWLSMVLVLFWQPLALRDAGFWFSFAAVAALLTVGRSERTHIVVADSDLARNHEERTDERIWFSIREVPAAVARLLLLQIVVFAVLSVVQISWGIGLNPVSPLANLLAIPYVSFAVVPPLLAGALADLLGVPLAEPLWRLSAWFLDGFWWGLEALSQLDTWIPNQWLPEWSVSPLFSVLALVGIGMAILPVAVPTRLLAALALLPVLFPLGSGNRDTQLWVLDVGQGLAVVVQSQGQTLLYDTGPSFKGGFNAAQSVILPFLRDQGVSSLTLGVVSHADTDHSGGVSAIEEAMLVKEWWLGQPLPQVQRGENCDTQTHFRLGEVRLWRLPRQSKREASSNDYSCVILMEVRGTRILLPGDIESGREYQLLRHPLLQEPVQVIVAPHHGSLTSSTRTFVKQLQPGQVVVSAGYRNRYRHPHPKVVQRYREAGAVVFETAEMGALRFHWSDRDVDSGPQITAFRETDRHYWHWQRRL
jgi:competence protein ComEC